MKRLSLLLLLFPLCLGGLNAQTAVEKLNPLPHKSPKLLNGGDSLKILAVMVEFQEDKDDATKGDGKFGSIYTRNYGNTILDPLPHDVNYFSAHLEFAKNYFRKVSKDNLNINYLVLPDTITVSQAIRAYSPARNSDDLSLLGTLCDEVWQLATAKYKEIDFSEYDLFTIFHAGVSRGLSDPSSFGNERDLPSVYLSTEALKNIFGEDFEGFPSGVGDFKITNTMILPETLSREVSSITETVLVEATINGLLANNIGSYLGLPDLFNTETGLSAIGRFGLMDGQALIAYRGLFPPEPSPWEKIYLGWETPVLLNSPGENISITARLAAESNEGSIYKLPINSTEYYLIENRSRDALKNGAHLKLFLNNQTIEKYYPKDTTGFQSFEVDSIDGVLTDLDEFDWALPGEGILIWHIDEKIISDKITSNQVNNDKFFRGVDVEEADGIQDIGEEFVTVFGDVVIGEGFPEDFWYSSNPAEVYINEFSPESTPNTNSYSGANSLITLKNFSDISTTMTFDLSFSQGDIKLLSNEKIVLPGVTKFLVDSDSPEQNSFYLINGSDLYRYIPGNNPEKIIENFSEFKPASVYKDNTEFLFGVIGNSLKTSALNETESNYFVNNIGETISSVPVIIQNGNSITVIVGTEKGNLFTFSPDQISGDSLAFIESLSLFENEPVSYICAVTGYYIAGNERKIVDSGGNIFVSNENILQTVLSSDENGDYFTVILTDDNKIKILKNGLLVNDLFSADDTEIGSFILGDLKQDGSNYVIYPDAEEISAKNLEGAFAGEFPFTGERSAQLKFLLASDINNDGVTEVLAPDAEGTIFAVSGMEGQLVAGFPLTTGNDFLAHPLIFSLFDSEQGNESTGFAALTSDNSFFVWKLSNDFTNDGWTQHYGNSLNNSFVKSAASTNQIETFFPQSRTYNWPNPVYDGETYIRYYVGEDADITIKVFDLGGDLVAEMTDKASGGLDNEIVWNVENIQSGIYFAHIEANGKAGNSDSKIIKIAVIK